MAKKRNEIYDGWVAHQKSVDEDFPRLSRILAALHPLTQEERERYDSQEGDLIGEVDGVTWWLCRHSPGGGPDSIVLMRLDEEVDFVIPVTFPTPISWDPEE